MSSTINIVYPCTICDAACLDDEDCICCDGCDKWTHLKCSKLSVRKFKSLCNNNKPFYCDSCLSNMNCYFCDKLCRNGQNSILCNSCNRWQHFKCTSLSYSQFETFSNSAIDYYCTKCSKLLLPFNSLDSYEIISLYNNNSITQNRIRYNNMPALTGSAHADPTLIKADFDKDTFSTLSLNIRSLNRNFGKLEILLQQLDVKPDIIATTETWISDSRPLIHTLNDYTFINKSSDGIAGGAGIFVKNNLDYKIINLYNLDILNCEDLWIELSLNNNKKLVVASLYRHPDYHITDFQNKFSYAIDKLNSQNKHFIIGGDFNIDLLHHTPTTLNYINELEAQGSRQAVDNFTRVSWKNKESLLDHIYTNIHQDELHVKTLAYDISDHLPIITYTNIFSSPTNKSKYLIRDTKNFNSDNFLEDLEKQLGEITIDNDTAQDNWNKFENCFNSILDNHAPLRFCTQKEIKQRSKPWITPAILKSIKTKQKLYKLVLKHSKNDEYWCNFKKYGNKLTHIIEQSEQLYFKQRVAQTKNNSKKLWQTVNDIIKFKNKDGKKIVKTTDEHDKIIDKPTEVSNLFNDFFVSIGTKLSNQNSINNNFQHQPTTSNK